MSTRQLLIYGARASRKGEAHRHRRALRVREVLLGPPLFEGFRLPVPKKKVSKRRNRRYINPAKTGYVCNLCNVVRSCRKALKAHIHSVHGPKPPKINQVRCAECYQIHERGAAYHNHLKKVHKIRFTRESKVFSSKAEFEKWKLRTEQAYHLKYRIRYKKRGFESTLVQFECACNSPPMFVSRINPRRYLFRRPKLTPLLGCCPSHISVLFGKKVHDEVLVLYSPTHVGHHVTKGRYCKILRRERFANIFKVREMAKELVEEEPILESPVADLFNCCVMHG